MKKTIIIIALIAISIVSFSQKEKDPKTVVEEVKQLCKDLPSSQKVNVSVAAFKVSTTAPRELGENMAAMLENAIQGTNCFNVLLSTRNKADINDEIDYGESKYAKSSAAPKKGKQLGAHVIFTGELTEYSVKNKGIGIGIIRTGSNIAKIGFIVKMINPETRVTIEQKSFNVEGKAGGSTNIGFYGINLGSTSTTDPAVANALEKGIIFATEYLVKNRDKVEVPQAAALMNESSIRETEIVLTNANFSSFNAFATTISELGGFKSMEKSLKSGTGSYLLSHTGTAEKILDELNKKIGNKYEVIGFETGKIEVKVK